MIKILITGHGSLEHTIDALNLGAAGYISKPIKPEELLTTVNKRLASRNNNLKMTQKKIIRFIDKKLGELPE